MSWVTTKTFINDILVSYKKSTTQILLRGNLNEKCIKRMGLKSKPYEKPFNLYKKKTTVQLFRSSGPSLKNAKNER